MPNYKIELKQAIYADNLPKEEGENFREMIRLLDDKTPDEYITDIDKQIKGIEKASKAAYDKYEEKKDAIEKEYDDSASELFNKWHEAALELDAPGEALQLAAEALYRQEVSWGTTFKNEKGLSEVYDQIQAEIKAAGEKGQNLKVEDTEIYKSYDYYHQGHIAAYQSSMDTFDLLAERKPAVGEIVKENFIAYKNKMAEFRQTRDEKIAQIPDIDESEDLDNVAKNLYAKKEDMIKFKNGPYKSMGVMDINDIKEKNKSNALDMLTKARVEYRNKLNGWQRMWANILPSWLYGNAKYVDKINAYKETLSEMGFSDKQIEKADPTKDPDYAYNKANGRYVKVKDDSNKAEEKEIEDNTPVKENDVQFILEGQTFTNESIVPAKNNNDKQKDFHKGLGEVTSDNKMDVKSKVNQKTENNPQLNKNTLK